MEARALENEYVPQNIFDLHIQNIKERATSDRELFDERFEKLQAISELCQSVKIVRPKLHHFSSFR